MLPLESIASLRPELMSLFDTRTKSVTFRLSAEEFDALKTYCISKKIRSISALAREAILQKIQAERPAHGLITGDLTALGSALGDIDVALKKLSGKISKVLGPPRK